MKNKSELTHVINKTQADRLGKRLRDGLPSEADLRTLDEYRRSFGEASEQITVILRERLGLEPTTRPAKSTSSIIEKLKRESIRLSQMQDIAGCRVIVQNVLEQDRVTQSIQNVFEQCSISDRRRDHSHGYRAVHTIVKVREKLVEIQIRTQIEHRWAELSEKLSDVIDPAIKYGGGPIELHRGLIELSALVGRYEDVERELRNKNQHQNTTIELDELYEQIIEYFATFKKVYAP